MGHSDIRHLVIVSDTHGGSTVALCPPGHRLQDGGEYKLSPAQKVLWAKWREFWDEFVPTMTGGESYGVLDNGDCCEGIHHGTGQLISPAEIDQIDIGVRLREPIIAKPQCKFLTITRGTPTHTGSLSWREEAVARRISDGDSNGPYTDFAQLLRVGDYTVHAAHHIGGTSSPISAFTALSREMALGLQDTARFGGEMPDLIVRSHIHQEKSCSLPIAGRRITVQTTPAWQLKTEYGWKHFRFDRPQIGGMVVTADKYELTIRRFLWVPPTNGPMLQTRGKPSSSRSATKRPRKD